MSDSMKEVDSSGSKSTIIEFQPISPSFSSLDELVSRESDYIYYACIHYNCRNI